MFCKKCGKEIDDDSKFCSYCGAPVSADPVTTEADDADSSEPRIGKKGIFWIIIICIIAFSLLVAGIYQLSEKNSGTDNSGIMSRSAKSSDISVKTSEAFSLSYDIIVTPNTNISGLVITIDFYGDDKKLVATKSRTMGNVEKNKSYTLSFSLSEFSLSSLTKISYYKYNVTGGTVN